MAAFASRAIQRWLRQALARLIRGLEAEDEDSSDGSTPASATFAAESAENSQQINVDAWQGTITLRSLELKPDAFEQLGLPLAITHGLIGAVDIAITWPSLTTPAVSVRIAQVSVLARLTSPEPDPERAAQAALEAKRRFLAAFAQPDAADVHAGLFFRLFERLQIHVEDLHIRVELPGPTNAVCGVRLDALDLSNGEALDGVHVKPFNVTNLSVYISTSPPSPASRPASTAPEMLAFLARPLPPGAATMSPISLAGRATLKPGELGALHCDLTAHCPPVALTVGLAHLETLQHTAAHLHAVQTRNRFASLRAAFPAQPSARQRWQYACDCILLDYRRERVRWSWAAMATRRDQRRAYVPLCRTVLTAGWALAPYADLAALDALDAQLSVVDIVRYRRLAAAGLPPAPPGWLSFLGLTRAAPPPDTMLAEVEAALDRARAESDRRSCFGPTARNPGTHPGQCRSEPHLSRHRRPAGPSRGSCGRVATRCAQSRPCLCARYPRRLFLYHPRLRKLSSSHCCQPCSE
eukprot:m.125755 g.125755  ORF g.125755 m.125755 type:complete len:525 (+) comp14678_c1_seq2:40-1614(+)